MEKILGVIIAGGKSSRMRTNKAIINYKGKRLIDYAINVLKPLVYKIVISTNEDLNLGYEQIADKQQNLGPIGGLYTVLSSYKSDYYAIIPCDVPKLNTAFYQYLINNMNGYDAVVPRLADGKLEPLIAIYSNNILPIIKQQINIHDYKLVHVLDQINVNYLDVDDLSIFKNFNTMTDIDLPKWNNMLLVAGTDRNVGKTTFVCKLIRKISQYQKVIAIKITPHFHVLPDKMPVLYKNNALVIAEEIYDVTGKDSAKMLATGAQKVYYVQSNETMLETAIEKIRPLIPDETPVICESAALRSYVNPGCFVLLSKNGKHKKNIDKHVFANFIFDNFNYNIENFKYENNQWVIGDV